MFQFLLKKKLRPKQNLNIFVLKPIRSSHYKDIKTYRVQIGNCHFVLMRDMWTMIRMDK